jgi:phosphoribosylformimino-5-aminoimidazole carboxamide ribotide isomerase
MHFLPVIDVRNGIVVRALAGRRSEYRPLVSTLTESTDPLTVATSIRHHFGWADLYVADIDAILGGPPGRDVWDGLRAAGFAVWLDAGVRDPADAERLAGSADRVVVGLETVRGPAAWREIVAGLGADRAVFSLDLRDGRPLSDAWGTTDPLAIAERVVADGGRQMIVLDLARVGTGGGTGTEGLCRELLVRHPELAVHAGGGIRGWDDVRRLETAGVAGVLLASTLHDGTFDQRDQ